ncbi:nucleotidyl transferase AbiEii/AbiGii toxin family protein [Ohessyouella blattaphilus]|uniref:Nucleotidyl transferase AbiEii/AbiGii toxin family protein n=1 Tax=Ohessyouella blattaphilus TaxID=2949333 RepID=A0ABT1EDQ9_9FIRM|nr:nucleotidyl transferase AbiEii/AbiGii toxin family protein [Ohessyouella blattaphilus]MCP1108834.1 nucleotidyl transferase AbiEii/AbiGii toxin family protein [Ohessyouella blattaphilus]MCR8562228.1 nucleotidyl transferase AbiEii/AbiGii toxin family protein [Ohessyouella blattaphilus]
MILHHDKEAFEELITATSNVLHIPTTIVEKDYYVTLALKELSQRIPGMVFKGGTSLSKCYQIIDRFSEDIDISLSAEDGIPGESRKRSLKKSVIAAMDALNLQIKKLDDIQSRRNYNCYHVDYTSIYSPILSIKPELIIETYITLLPFPTVKRSADNYIHHFLETENMEHLAQEYELMPFSVATQAIERTFVDKVFAICDYYLTGKTDKHSRHLYDIHKICSSTPFTPALADLVHEVRLLREPLSLCPSAAKEVDINQVLKEIIEKSVYKKDYHNITERLLFAPVSYEAVITSLKQIIELGYFK